MLLNIHQAKFIMSMQYAIADYGRATLNYDGANFLFNGGHLEVACQSDGVIRIMDIETGGQEAYYNHIEFNSAYGLSF